MKKFQTKSYGTSVICIIFAFSKLILMKKSDFRRTRGKKLRHLRTSSGVLHIISFLAQEHVTNQYNR